MSTAKALTEQDLKNIEARAEAATQGPWRECGANAGKCICNLVWTTALDVPVATTDPDRQDMCGRLDADVRANNAIFIAHAREDIPALLAEVRRLRRFEEDSRSKGSPPEIDEAIGIILDAADRGDLEGVASIEAVGTRRLLVRLESGGVVSFDAGDVDP